MIVEEAPPFWLQWNKDGTLSCSCCVVTLYETLLVSFLCLTMFLVHGSSESNDVLEPNNER